MVIKVMVMTKREDQVLQLGKEEREKQKPRRLRQMYQIGFCFGTQDIIEGMSVFRIDSHTIKREKLWLSGYQVPLGEVIIAYALGPSVLTINP
jgi:hypothetical protein